MWGKNKERPIHLNLAYEYRYLDTLYTGKNLAFYEIHWPQTGNFANEHTVGQAITVYVDPKNPSTSVLITGRHPKKPYFDMMWSFLCVIIAVGLASAFWINK